MVSPGTSGFTSGGSPSVPLEPLLEGLGDEAAPATRTGNPIDLGDKRFGQQQVCAHGHAQTIAHASAGSRQEDATTLQIRSALDRPAHFGQYLSCSFRTVVLQNNGNRRTADAAP